MSSLVAYATQALTRLGADPISSLEEESIESRTMGLLWRPVLTRCLNAAPWRFAEADQELSRLLTTPTDSNWTYEFQYPADYRRTVQVLSPDGRELPSGTYTSRGGLLLSTRDRVHLVYGRSYSEGEIVDLPEWFGQYFVMSLAFEAAPMITNVGTDVTRMREDANLTKAAAIQADREQAPAKSYVPISTWRAVRS